MQISKLFDLLCAYSIIFLYFCHEKNTFVYEKETLFEVINLRKGMTLEEANEKLYKEVIKLLKKNIKKVKNNVAH